MSPGVIVANRVYASLKREIMTNRFKPGELLPGQTLARELGTSISPVRDAMAQLCGERLLTPAPDGGFQRPALTERSLRDLYRWQMHLLRLAMRDPAKDWTLPDFAEVFDTLDPAAPAAIADATAQLFQAIAERSTNLEHVEALRSITVRLHAVRLTETDLPQRIEELKMVATAIASGHASAARAAIWAYERRRLRRIRSLVQAAGGTTTPSNGR